ncbi:helix-hairpin-helix domain-containing protein, partial [Propionibacterium freudenreichii]
SRPGTVNINTANAAALDQLPGVGPVTAEKIIAWRTQHGKFTRVDQLREVDGIGAKSYERMKDSVTVG